MAGVNPPGFGVSRVGPVYTPPEHRGRGYAGAAVAEVSRRVLEAGLRVCLFTDQANPTSNRIYQRLGYRPVAHMVSLEVGSRRGARKADGSTGIPGPDARESRLAADPDGGGTGHTGLYTVS